MANIAEPFNHDFFVSSAGGKGETADGWKEASAMTWHLAPDRCVGLDSNMYEASGYPDADKSFDIAGPRPGYTCESIAITRNDVSSTQ